MRRRLPAVVTGHVMKESVREDLPDIFGGEGRHGVLLHQSARLGEEGLVRVDSRGVHEPELNRLREAVPEAG